MPLTLPVLWNLKTIHNYFSGISSMCMIIMILISMSTLATTLTMLIGNSYQNQNLQKDYSFTTKAYSVLECG